MTPFTITAVLGLFGVTLVRGACLPGWRENSGSCYMFQRERLNWVNARTMCKWHNSDLIAIETAEEQKWFTQQALTFNHTEMDDGFWLGATCWTEPGKWFWESANNALVTYTLWGPDQPNNRNNNESCLASIHGFNYAWSDDPCVWDRLQYVCERPETGNAPVG